MYLLLSFPLSIGSTKSLGSIWWWIGYRLLYTTLGASWRPLSTIRSFSALFRLSSSHCHLSQNDLAMHLYFKVAVWSARCAIVFSMILCCVLFETSYSLKLRNFFRTSLTECRLRGLLVAVSFWSTLIIWHTVDWTGWRACCFTSWNSISCLLSWAEQNSNSDRFSLGLVLYYTG